MPSARSEHSNPAIRRCLEAYKCAYEAEFAKRQDRVRAELAAEAAYRSAMPLLVGRANIRNYIACVGHGILIGTVYPNHSGSLLYAAQVALNGLPRKPRLPGRPRGAAEPAHAKSPRSRPETPGPEIPGPETPGLLTTK